MDRKAACAMVGGWVWGLYLQPESGLRFFRRSEWESWGGEGKAEGSGGGVGGWVT